MECDWDAQERGGIARTVRRRIGVRRSRVGVTLIELVVTLTLLAVLAAVVTPILRAPPVQLASDPPLLESGRRAALRVARVQEAITSSGDHVVISPLGTCHPSRSMSTVSRADRVWDPIRCTTLAPVRPVAGDAP